MDKQLIENQITGLKERIAALRRDRDLFIKVQGINEEIEKLKSRSGDLSSKADRKKGELSVLQVQRKQIVRKTIMAITAKMKTVLPVGTPDIEIPEDGGVYIGWVRPDGHKVPYGGLSGGEKVVFDSALASALKANVIIQESAELDGKHLAASLAHFNGDLQVIISSCHAPASIPQGWKEIKLS